MAPACAQHSEHRTIACENCSLAVCAPQHADTGGTHSIDVFRFEREKFGHKFTCGVRLQHGRASGRVHHSNARADVCICTSGQAITVRETRRRARAAMITHEHILAGVDAPTRHGHHGHPRTPARAGRVARVTCARTANIASRIARRRRRRTTHTNYCHNSTECRSEKIACELASVMG